MRRSLMVVRWNVVAGCALALLIGAGAGTAVSDVSAQDGVGTEDRGIGTRAVPAKPAGAVRIATYNVMNLFDDRDDPSLSDRMEDIDDTKPASELQSVAGAIRAIDADVLALQEIESYDALVEFRAEHLAGMGYEHVMSIDVGQERGIENAVLSRFPIREAMVRPNQPLGGVHPELYNDRPNWYAGEPITFRRAPLRVVIEVPAGERDNDEAYAFTMFVVHHKSGSGNDYWRVKEASAVVEMIAEVEDADREANVIVLGDFNATPEQDPIKLYLEDADLEDVFGDFEGGYDHTTHESRRRIDYIMVNDAMQDELLEDSVFVYSTPVRPRGANWRTTPAPAGFASDHVPVVADFAVGGHGDR